MKKPTLNSLIELGGDFADWYSDAHSQIKYVCFQEPFDITYFTDIMALLSPRCSVLRNIRMTLTYVKHGQFLADVSDTFKRSVINYENGKGFSKQAFKTLPFSKALRGDLNAIVIDTWMCQVFGITQDDYRRKPIRQHTQKRVIRLAKKHDLKPAQVQACLWAGFQRHLGENPARFDLTVEYNNWLTYDRNYPLSGTIERIPF